MMETVNLTIDKLMIDTPSPVQKAQLRTAIMSHLQMMLAQQPLPEQLLTSGHIAKLAAPLTVESDKPVQQQAKEIAQAIYQALLS